MLDLENSGYIVIASVSSPEAAENIQNQGHGYIRALVLDPADVSLSASHLPSSVLIICLFSLLMCPSFSDRCSLHCLSVFPSLSPAILITSLQLLNPTSTQSSPCYLSLHHPLQQHLNNSPSTPITSLSFNQPISLHSPSSKASFPSSVFPPMLEPKRSDSRI